MAPSRPLKGESLAELEPSLAAEWHPTKNGTLSPSDVRRYSMKKVWWRCTSRHDHEWVAAIGNRTQGRGCPYCGGKAVKPGFNDLATTDPDLAAQWHPRKNGDLSPTMVTRGTGKIVWWKCAEGDDHEWKVSVSNRSFGTGCPICTGRTVAPSTSLAAVHPDVAAEWHPTANGDARPDSVTPYVTKRAWWRCSLGHTWRASIASRTRMASGCPYCSGKRSIPGQTDLETTHPEVAAQWHPTRNGTKTPQDVKAGTGTSFWWLCEDGHEWSAPPANRTLARTGCPYCAGQRAIVGTNDLATTHPEVASLWHPTRNGNLGPHNVMAGTSRKVWWRCTNGHDWTAQPWSLAGLGTRCPVCAGKKVLAGYNDLETVDPELAVEWHPTKNEQLKTRSVSRWSGKKVWWICDKGHDWPSTVSNRSIGQGCPVCSPTGFSPALDGWLYLLSHPDWEMQQIGISNYPETRLAQHRTKGWEVVDLRGPMTGDLTAHLERSGLQALASRGALLGKRGKSNKFDGYTEAWSVGSLRLSSLAELIGWIHENE